MMVAVVAMRPVHMAVVVMIVVIMIAIGSMDVRLGGWAIGHGLSGSWMQARLSLA